MDSDAKGRKTRQTGLEYGVALRQQSQGGSEDRRCCVQQVMARVKDANGVVGALGLTTGSLSPLHSLPITEVTGFTEETTHETNMVSNAEDGVGLLWDKDIEARGSGEENHHDQWSVPSRSRLFTGFRQHLRLGGYSLGHSHVGRLPIRHLQKPREWPVAWAP